MLFYLEELPSFFDNDFHNRFFSKKNQKTVVYGISLLILSIIPFFLLTLLGNSWSFRYYCGIDASNKKILIRQCVDNVKRINQLKAKYVLRNDNL